MRERMNELRALFPNISTIIRYYKMMRTVCFNMPLFLLTFQFIYRYIFGRITSIISRSRFYAEWNLMICIWNFDAKIKMKMEREQKKKKITTNFARPNKRFVANAEQQCGVVPYAVYDSFLWTVPCTKMRVIIMLLLLRVFQNETFHTLLPITSARVDSVVFDVLRSVMLRHTTDDRKRKPSELFNYIFMCERLISMSADDERAKKMP